MKNNSKPIRTCVYTKIKKEKEELIRLVKDENGKYILDESGKAQKRGIYIYPTEKSLIMLEKNKKYKINESEISKIKDEIIKRIKVGEVNVK